MAAPTAPTINSIIIEALKKSGNVIDYTRAKNEWFQEIKSDIWNLAKNLKSLQVIVAYGLSEGLSHYQFPTDYSSLLTATLLDGSEYDTCQDGGTTGTIVLAAGYAPDSDWMLGKEIMVYSTSTPTTGYIAQCTCWTPSTTIPTATVSPALAISPDSDYSYLVVDTYHPLNIQAIWKWEQEHFPTAQRVPRSIHPLGDETLSGEFFLLPTPDDAYYGLKLRYYANLMTLDEAGTLFLNLLYRWRNIWIQGIMAKQLESNDDKRARAEVTRYNNMLQTLMLRETYGLELSELQTTIGN